VRAYWFYRWYGPAWWAAWTAVRVVCSVRPQEAHREVGEGLIAAEGYRKLGEELAATSKAVDAWVDANHDH
jgi:hypothetical protein